MADNKISQLSSLTTVLPGDDLPIVDNGQTYRVTSNRVVVQNIITGILVTGQSTLSKIVGGTSLNSATGVDAGVLAGNANAANSQRSVICGGTNNTIKDGSNIGFIGGGNLSSIGNTIVAAYAFIGNGSANTADGTNATILNGSSSIVTGTASLIGNGASNESRGPYATILNGTTNINLGDYSSILNGNINGITGTYSLIGNGDTNYIVGSVNYATILNGQSNLSSGNKGTILGGQSNIVGGPRCMIGGGTSNKITDGATDSASILNGTSNTIRGASNRSCILNGQSNIINSAASASILAGDSNQISGNYQVAVGRNIEIDSSYAGAIVLSDSRTASKYAFSKDSLTFQFQSGVMFSGTDLMLDTNYNLPLSSTGLGRVGTLKISGHNLLICTGMNLWGKLTITSF